MIRQVISTKFDRRVLNLVLSTLLTLCVFATIYYILFAIDKNNFKGANTLLDIIYFTTTTQSSGSYGDITPNSQLTKFFVMIQHLVVIAIATDFVVSIIRQ